MVRTFQFITIKIPRNTKLSHFPPNSIISFLKENSQWSANSSPLQVVRHRKEQPPPKSRIHMLRSYCDSSFTNAHSLSFSLSCAFSVSLAVLCFSFPQSVDTTQLPVHLPLYNHIKSPFLLLLVFISQANCWEGQHVLEIEIEILELKHLELRKSWNVT